MRSIPIHFLYRTIIFLLTLSVGYVGLIIISGEALPAFCTKNLNYRRGSPGHALTRFREVKEASNVDILFLGSSHSYRSFDPRIFASKGYSSFNLGSSAQTPIQTNLLLKRYLSVLRPRVVVYEVYPATFSIDGVESALDIIANDENDKHSLAMARQLNNVKVYNTLIFAMFRQLLSFGDSDIEAIKKGKDTYISGGYVERRLSYYKYKNPEKLHWDIIDNQFGTFKETINMLKGKDIPVLLVQAPMPKSTVQSYDNNDQFDSRISEVGDYFNFNKLAEFNDSLDFYDRTHLNSNGVKKLDEALLSEIDKVLHGK